MSTGAQRADAQPQDGTIDTAQHEWLGLPAFKTQEEGEAWAHEHGCAGVMLHVFGYNTAARELYRSVGFEETNVIMLKRIEGGPAG